MTRVTSFYHDQILWLVWFIWANVGLTAGVDALRPGEKPESFFWRHWWHIPLLVLLEWALGGLFSSLLDLILHISSPGLGFWVGGQLAGDSGFVLVALGWALWQARSHIRWKAQKRALDAWKMRSQRGSLARASTQHGETRKEPAGLRHVKTRLVAEGLRKQWLEAASHLAGTTLLVYWYLVANRGESTGPRKVQRALGFRSPSTALFHLEKLTQVNLVQPDGTGGYRVARVMKVGLMRSFISISGILLPKSIIYALFTTLLLVTSGVILLPLIGWLLSLAWVPGVFAVAIFLDEALTVWRLRPHFVRENSE